MSVWQLVIKEIIRRKVNFVSGLLAVLLAAAVLAGAMTTLHVHDLQTEGIVAQKEEETRQRMVTGASCQRGRVSPVEFSRMSVHRG